MDIRLYRALLEQALRNEAHGLRAGRELTCCESTPACQPGDHGRISLTTSVLLPQHVESWRGRAG